MACGERREVAIMNSILLNNVIIYNITLRPKSVVYLLYMKSINLMTRVSHLPFLGYNDCQETS